MGDQGLFPVKTRAAKHRLDLAQAETEFPEEKNLLQALKIGVSIEAVARRTHRRRFEQPDGVVVVQGAGY
jgi:hypothetical protein